MEMDRIAMKRELLKGLKGYANKGVAEGLKKEYCSCAHEDAGAEEEPGMELEGMSESKPDEAMDEEKLLLMLKGGM